MFEALLIAMADAFEDEETKLPKDHSELRTIIINEILNNMEKYNYRIVNLRRTE